MDGTPELTGWQSAEEWMGAPVLTLADVWPAEPRAVIVGINPSPVSVAAGHYYQGQVGRRQLGRIAAALGWEVPASGWFEEAAARDGVGFTDIVKRPTPREGGVTAAELAHGRALLEAELKARGVPLVICVFRQPVKALLGSEGRPGLQPERTSWGAQVFRMPGPFDAAGSVDGVMVSLARLMNT